MTDRVAGKVVLITGGARGQGRAHAVRLAEEGADIILVDICGPLPTPYPDATPEELAETASLVEEQDRRVVTAQVDIRDLAALRASVDGAVGQLGRLDVVVANAGIVIPSTWDEQTPEDFENTLATNVTGTWNTIMVAAPHLIAAGGGSIITISSVTGLVARPFSLAYSTSKFAVRGMTKAFALELGEHNIRVNSVHPGPVQSPMGTGRVPEIIGEAMAAHPQFGNLHGTMLPLDAAQGSDIAQTVLFLASDESRYYTAQEFTPDAGNTG
ncbi:mycofactocin-coupled SDR family oxidoreductase [Pseudonocardia halophobica]|uniref:3-ketoacyl-ACP reductase n=1 Tax=Pseudonocardia halophobica TaxID=29401 RepID=A0A9W6NVP5_9PSEU|nr:mycofactocin-coupled SDR family oxidoreductase [Pseudonocardia halophobica]GLL10617.1 3-ketoacyl-ACP reductase [Pseudonocardia halophobica]